MSPRSRIVGPGRPPVSRAAIPLVVSCTVTSSGEALDRAEDVLLGDRQVVAELGPLVQRAAQFDGAAEEVVGLLAQAGRVDGHRAMVGTASMSGTPDAGADPGDELVDIVDEDDVVVATVTRREMRAAQAAPPRRVHRRHVDERGAARPPSQRRQGPVARSMGRRRRGRRRGRRDVRGRRRTGAGRGGRGGRGRPVAFADGRYADADVRPRGPGASGSSTTDRSGSPTARSSRPAGSTPTGWPS